jgi:hypothetical protein
MHCSVIWIYDYINREVSETMRVEVSVASLLAKIRFDKSLNV